MRQHDQIWTKYARKSIFSKSNCKKGNKSFWNAIKPFCNNRCGITLEENGVLKKRPEKTAEVVNNDYKNIVETISRKIGNPNSKSQDRAAIKKLNLAKTNPVHSLNPTPLIIYKGGRQTSSNLAIRLGMKYFFLEREGWLRKGGDSSLYIKFS